MAEKRRTKDSILQIISFIIMIALAVEVILLSRENRKLKRNQGIQSDNFQIESIQPGERAPDFKLESILGEWWDRSDHQGEWLYVVFFSPKCLACERAAVIWKKIQDERTRGLDIQLIGISGGTKEDIRQFAQNHALAFPILSDPQGEVARSYKVLGIPLMVLIDPEGVVQNVLYGVSQKDWFLFKEHFGIEITTDIFSHLESPPK